VLCYQEMHSTCSNMTEGPEGNLYCQRYRIYLRISQQFWLNFKDKALGFAYTRVMPHSHTLTARVSMARTISRPLGLCAGVGAHAAGSHTDCCCCGCIPVKSSTVTWHHSNNHTVQHHRSAKPHTSCQVSHCHVNACCSCYCELVDAHALSMHRSIVHVWRQFSLPAYTRVTNFCHIFGFGNEGRLIHGTAYTRVYTVHNNIHGKLHESRSVWRQFHNLCVSVNPSTLIYCLFVVLSIPTTSL